MTSILDAIGGRRAPSTCRDRAALEVLYGTGLRIAELVGLSLADVDLDGALLRAFGKGRKERIVPLGRARPAGPRGLVRPAVARRWPPSSGPAGPTPRRCSSTAGAGG